MVLAPHQRTADGGPREKRRAAVEGPLVGLVLGGTYRIRGIIDSGGMGVVYEAEHLRLHRPVAVKVLSGPLAARADVLGRFHQEAELLSSLRHPNVVDVLDFDVTEAGEPYIVMERLEGRSLASRLDEGGPVPVGEGVDIMTEIASALSAAHEAGIVHRDLKPGNVFLVARGDGRSQAKLIDFGIGKRVTSHRHITLAGRLIGTPDYMAPEQARGQHDVDGRADQYALAVVGYEMLTGHQPFAGDDLVEVLRRVLELEVPPLTDFLPSVPPELDAVLRQALSKDRELRFASVADFASALRSTVARSPTEPPASHARPRLPSRQRPSSPASSPAAHLERARVAFAAGRVPEAAVHAAAAVLESAGSEVIVQVGAPLLEGIFRAHLGGVGQRLTLGAAARSGIHPLSSPRSAFLMSRLEDGMTIQEALDVAGMGRLEAMARLCELVSGGVVSICR